VGHKYVVFIVSRESHQAGLPLSREESNGRLHLNLRLEFRITDGMIMRQSLMGYKVQQGA